MKPRITTSKIGKVNRQIAIRATCASVGAVSLVFAIQSAVQNNLAMLIVFSILLIASITFTILSYGAESRAAKVSAAENFKRIEDVSSETNRRLYRLNPIIQNTAGSIGRAAPIIRSNNQLLTKALAGSDGVVRSNITSNAPTAIGPPKESVTKNPLALPPAEVRPHSRSRIDLTVMIIADEFTRESFRYEWTQIEPTPESWRTELDNYDVDLLVVESAWEGNQGSWKYHIAGQSAPRPALQELVSECKARGIPTIFWNKEDPPHYNDFIATAKLFDLIFTTDERMIPQYGIDAPSSQVDTLAFAAQPAIHSPARPMGLHRTESIVFGGMYFRHKYPERRDQMDYLLPAAGKYGLHIYSRQLGTDSNYQFPESLKDFVIGSLSYREMVNAYHKYKVVVNVNSVVGSPSMCARRIFEATASGAAVVTSPSDAIANFYPNGLVTEVDDSAAADTAFKTLSRSTQYRERKVHLAQRHTWENHTYAHRVDDILEAAGLASPRTPMSISVLSPTNRPHMIENILSNFDGQTYDDRELVVLTHGFEVSSAAQDRLRASFDLSRVRFTSAPRNSTLGENLNRLVGMAEGNVVARMDDDDWYGANYLRDMSNSLRISGAELAGKAASYIYFEARNETILTYPAKEKVFSDFVRGATTVSYRDLMSSYPYHAANKSEDSDLLTRLAADGVPVYASDRFNFSVFRSSDLSAHTWQEADANMYATGELKYIGRALDQISI